MSDSYLVYSTDTGRIKQDKQKQSNSPVNSDGIVRLRRETKGRKGKGVTTVSGVPGSASELKTLCSALKKSCGTGGAVKDNTIEIQGDNREKIKSILEKRGYTVKLAGG